jgi:hypothetical protein
MEIQYFQIFIGFPLIAEIMQSFFPTHEKALHGGYRFSLWFIKIRQQIKTDQWNLKNITII